MKLIKVLPLSLLLVFFVTTSCEKEDSEFVASNSTPIALEDLTISDVVIDGSNPNNPAVTFNWTNADFSEAVVENYSVEFSSDQAFTSPVEGTSTAGTSSVTMTMSQLNSTADNAGLAPLVSSPVYVRVIGSIGDQSQLPVVSNTISFNVTPFFNYSFKDFYLVGNGTSADWNNNNNNPALFRDPVDSDFYTFTGYFTKGGGGFNDGRFKVLESRGQWQPQWGVSADEGSDNIENSGSIAGNPATQDSDPGRFGVDADGFYTFTIDFDAMTYTMNPFDASGAADFTSMTIQGSALSASTSMQQSSFDSHLWYISSITLVPGELQFMTNTGSTWAGTTEFSGQATEGSDSIPVIVGDDYEVWFSDLTGDYIMIPLTL
ncbi:SusE domain-containing protein [Winogradskyella algicola]|uniref:SusE domain-containing protein n=1 Tax=Winogradskyella algicola TaxID=2575815 RepID=UPI0011085F55|nr:SusE domain-containing protein [Winogradskyella algicola]